MDNGKKSKWNISGKVINSEWLADHRPEWMADHRPEWIIPEEILNLL